MHTNINELINWIEAQKRAVPKVSLERMRTICRFYGNPEQGITYIHVGGTNGKGSTVSYIKSVLMAAGYNVGAFISPYVDVFNERISYNNHYISNEDLLDIGNCIIGKYHLFAESGMPGPSFFEFMTLCAFIYFSRQKDLDIAILEVGIGGALDSTNIITPVVSIITSISYDHMKILGSTLPEIAANKLGIVKEGVGLVTVKNDEIAALVESRARKMNSPLIYVDPKEVKNIKVSLDNTVFHYGKYKRLKTGLLGFHQAENAALAVEVINVLRKKHYRISDKALYDGLLGAKWPGRLQLIHDNPPVLLDGAHNPGGIARLVQFLKSVKGNKRLHIIFAVSADKAKTEMIEMLDEIADEIIFSMFEYKRSDTAEALAVLSHNRHIRVENDWRVLLKEAREQKEVMSVFCGSLYFVSEIYNYMKHNEFLKRR